MKKILFCALLAAATLLNFSCTDEKAKVIKVYGSGEVTYVPDMVTMTVTIKDVESVLRDALAKTNETSRKLISLCKEYSIADEDVKTGYAQTGREYEWKNNSQVFKGFKSEQSIQITFRELDKIEKFTGDILALQVYSLGNFKYGHSKKSEFDSEANLLALDNAKSAAEKMAERMEVSIGDVLYISDVDSMPPMVYYDFSYETMSENKSLNSTSGFVVAPGILATNKNVVVTFEIK